MERKNAVIVAFGRSAIAKAIRGSLRYTGCADFGTQVLRGILERNPGFDPALAEDLICGCAIPEAEQAAEEGYRVLLLAEADGSMQTNALPPVASIGSTTMASRSLMSGGILK